MQGGPFLQCCESEDYEVTIGNVTCRSPEVENHAISCQPSHKPPPQSESEGGVQVLVVNSVLSTVSK